MVVTALDAAVFHSSGPSCPLAPAAEVASTRNARSSWRIRKSGTAGEESQNYVTLESNEYSKMNVRKFRAEQLGACSMEE